MSSFPIPVPPPVFISADVFQLPSETPAPLGRLASLPASSLENLEQPALFSAPWVFSTAPIGRFSSTQTCFDSRNDFHNLLGLTFLSEIHLWFDRALCGLQIIATHKNHRLYGPRYGKNQNAPQIFLVNCEAGEFITGVSGQRDSDSLFSLTFRTNLGREKTFGTMSALEAKEINPALLQEFTLSFPSDHRLLGFFGGFDDSGVIFLGALHQKEEERKSLEETRKAEGNSSSLE